MEKVPNLVNAVITHPWVEVFVPEDLQDTGDLRGYRARSLVAFVYGLVLVGLLFAFFYGASFGVVRGALVLLAGVGGAVVTPFLLRWTGYLDWSSNWLSGVLYVTLVALSAMTGGLDGPVLPWLVAIPVASLLLSSVGYGVGWAILVAFTYIGFYFVEQYGVHVPQLLTPNEVSVLRMSGLAGLTLAILQLVLSSRWMHEWLIEQLREAREEVERQALYDPLTDLPNRRSIDQRFSDVIDRSRREEVPFAVGLLDLDNFTAVNESLGHVAGDRAMKAFASRLRDLIPDDHVVARVGGDEFLLLLESIETDYQVAKLGESLERALELPFELEDTEVHLSASIGFARASVERLEDVDEGEVVEQLTRTADRAMFEAKDVPGTAWNRFDPAQRGDPADRIQHENRIREAVDEGEFTARYQPIYRVVDGQLIGAEVLARWAHPDRGILSAGEFIPLARQSELIHEIGVEVFEAAFRELRESEVWGFSDETFEIYLNLSPRQIETPEAIERVDALVEEAAPAEVELKLEITESEWLRSSKDIMELHNRGYKLVVDDFGQGYSSLSRLTEMPFSGLKIDRAFIHGMEQHEEDATIVEIVSELGRRLDVPVIAEGIENASQLEAVRRCGATLAQGYHLGRPEPIEELVERARRGPLEPAGASAEA